MGHLVGAVQGERPREMKVLALEDRADKIHRGAVDLEVGLEQGLMLVDAADETVVAQFEHRSVRHKSVLVGLSLVGGPTRHPVQIARQFQGNPISLQPHIAA